MDFKSRLKEERQQLSTVDQAKKAKKKANAKTKPTKKVERIASVVNLPVEYVPMLEKFQDEYNVKLVTVLANLMKSYSGSQVASLNEAVLSEPVKIGDTIIYKDKKTKSYSVSFVKMNDLLLAGQVQTALSKNNSYSFSRYLTLSLIKLLEDYQAGKENV